jgi:hypothetical protein
MFLKPPFDSVPNLMRPVGLNVPFAFRKVTFVSAVEKSASSYPLTWQLVIVTFSVTRA